MRTATARLLLADKTALAHTLPVFVPVIAMPLPCHCQILLPRVVAFALREPPYAWQTRSGSCQVTVVMLR